MSLFDELTNLLINDLTEHNAAIRQYNFNLPLMRVAPFFLIPFFRMLSFPQSGRWKYQDDQKYQA
jgi:hypothetical protein